MAQFNVNTHRFDPYKNFKFRVKWDGRYVLGVKKISAILFKTEAIAFREGGDPSTQRLSPSVFTFEPVSFERGITYDTEFEKWAQLVHHPGGDGGMSLKNFRKDLYIELLDEAARVVKGYKLYRCWVTEYNALPELDSEGNAIAIELIKVAYEGFERDVGVVEQLET
jgi:phage tail-like protein